MLRGRAFKFGNDISTDHIIPANYIQILAGDIPELAKHVMEDADPTFAGRVKPGDFIVAGESFGIGSSREQAPLVIKAAGVRQIADGDELEVDLEAGAIQNITKGIQITFDPLPPVMLNILNEGGLLPYVKKYGRFKL